MQVTDNFKIQEFVPRDIWKLHEAGKVDARWYINQKVPECCQFIKDSFFEKLKSKYPGLKAVVVECNTWHYKKNGFQRRGYRSWKWVAEMKAKGKRVAQYGMHMLGLAADVEVYLVYEDGHRHELDSDIVRKMILADSKNFMALGLTTLESGKYAKGWTHLDCRPSRLDHIKVVGI